MKNSLLFYITGWVWLAMLALPPQAMAQDDVTLRQQARALLGTINARQKRHFAIQKLNWAEHCSGTCVCPATAKIACASCHYPENHGADNRPRSITARGTATGLHSMTVFNTQTATAGLRWFGDRASGAEQAMGSITGSMGFDEREDLLAVLDEFNYGERFRTAYPGAETALTAGHYSQALEAYQRSLLTPAPFDAWLEGDSNALNSKQRAGLQQFLNLGCAGCHNGPLLGGDSLQKFGMAADCWKYTHSPEPHDGLMTKTGDESERYVFRVSPLRNVAATSPYFHDASVGELADAVRIMATVQLGRELDDATIEEVVAFLEALTGELPDHFPAPDGVPFSLPD